MYEININRNTKIPSGIQIIEFIMKILAFDPASVTGWSLIDDKKIIQYGTIITNNKMSIGERLNYIAYEVDKILDKIKPDIIAIEDTLLGISGVKTLSLLARINGVIIQRCYHNIKAKIYVINVTSWKKVVDSISKVLRQSGKFN